jgi:predicted RND superfamily exporter protein
LSRHALAISVGASVLFVLSIVAAERLQLRSDFTELLPQNDPELAQLHQIGARVGAPSNLIVAVSGPDPRANERFADALAKNLEPLLGGDLRTIDYRPDAARPFFEHNRPLYAELVDLRRIDDDLRKLLISRKNPAFSPFADPDLGEERDDPAKDLKRLKKQLDRRASDERFPNGYYESKDRTLLAIVTWTNSSGTGDQSGFRIRDDVQKIIDATSPTRFGDLTVQITGDVASAIEEHDALKSDIEWVSLVCSVLVLLVIVLYYRSVFSLAYIFFPTLLGVALAFGIAAFTIGYLNTNTAFLGSIILGNGINFGIILLARYREERIARPDMTVEQALVVAIRNTAQPTLGAALAAGVAYASLALTGFRGFRQFGEVGGVGMVTCWLATYSYCPALICFWERIRPRPPAGSASSVGRLTRAAEWVFRQRKLLILVATGMSLLALWSVAPVLRSPFEYDFSRLRNQRSRKHGAGDLYVRVGAIFPQDLAPIAIALLPQAGDAAAYRTALLIKDCAEGLTHARDPHASDPAALQIECARRVAAGEPTGGFLSAVSTAYEVLPKDQDAKLAVIADLRKRLADPTMALLSAEERRQLDAWAPPADLRRLTIGDLPEPIARRFREVDGTLGRIALIFPVRVWANWDGHNLIRLSGVIKNVTLPNGSVIDAAGSSSLFAAMLNSIARDGPIATGAAFVGVVLMVVLLFRRLSSIALVLLALFVGVLWMAGAGAAMGLKLNFLNFVALPVTLGIGVDYAVNVFARLTKERPENHARALAETGSAVVLCSTTTIIGYSSLLVASNGALRSFGKLADLGELGCLLAALVLVSTVAHVRSRRADQGGRAKPGAVSLFGDPPGPPSVG